MDALTWSSRARRLLALALSLSFGLSLAGLWLRPALAIDETRYLSVAWEMRVRGDYLVPHLNGEIYTHKPPLLFWLINLVWSVVGVSERAARLVAPAAGLVCLWLTAGLARRLWPDRPAAPALPPLLLGAMVAWALFTGLTMFDTLVTMAVLLGARGLLAEVRRPGPGSFLAMAASITLGILAKGPAILVYLVPPIVAAPWWSAVPPPGGWWKGGLRVAGALLLGAAGAAAWFIPAMQSGGESYLQQVFAHQVTGRVVDAFAHTRPLWWYLPLLPVVVIPWLFWIPPWKAFAGAARARALDSGTRFCLAWIGGALVVLSAAGGKQVHYLLPLLPATALLLGRYADPSEIIPRRALLLRGLSFQVLGLGLLISPWLPLPEKVQGFLPAWFGGVVMLSGLLILWPRQQTATQVVVVTAILIAVNLGLFQAALRPTYFAACDLEPFARQLHALQGDGRPLAYTGGVYHGQFQFLGRLEQPIEWLPDDEALQLWLAQNPRGAVIDDARPGRRYRKVPERPGVEELFRYETLRGFSWQRFIVWQTPAAERQQTPPATTP